jgi:hypothetical protein
MTAVLVAVGLAAVAACCFAGAAILQHGAVRACGARESLGARAMWRMVRTRRWLAGAGLAVTGSLLHVTALSLAPIVIVQPVGVLSLVLTVLFGTRNRGAGVRAAVAGVCTGTGGFVVLAALAAGSAHGSTARVGSVAVLLTGIIGLAAGGLAVRGKTRCLLLSASSAMMFGTGSALTRTVTATVLHSGPEGLWLALPVALLLVTGGWLQHQAYASGPAAVVVATTNVIDPITAVAMGIGVFGERASAGPVQAAAQIGLALLAAGAVIALSRSVPDPHLERPEPAAPRIPVAAGANH